MLVVLLIPVIVHHARIILYSTVLFYVSGLWTAALELQELHKDIVWTQTLTRLLHTQGIHILTRAPLQIQMVLLFL